MVDFEAGPEWREVRLELANYGAADFKRVRAIGVGTMGPGVHSASRSTTCGWSKIAPGSNTHATQTTNQEHPRATPDSMVGYMIGGDGRVMRHMPFVILFNLAWLFVYPILAHVSFVHVILPTLISVPLFPLPASVHVFLRRAEQRAPAVHRRRIPAGLRVVTISIWPALAYLIFGYFSFAFVVPTRVAWKVIAIVAARTSSRCTCSVTTRHDSELRPAGGAARHIGYLHRLHHAPTGTPAPQ